MCVKLGTHEANTWYTDCCLEVVTPENRLKTFDSAIQVWERTHKGAEVLLASDS